MLRVITTLVAFAAFTLLAAAPARAQDAPDHPPTVAPTAQASADEPLGLGLGFEVWGHSIGLAGLVLEYGLTDELRIHSGLNAGMAGIAAPLALGWTPMGRQGFAPTLEAGATVYRTFAGCGGGCGTSETIVLPHAAAGITWFGDGPWLRAQVVLHVIAKGDLPVLPMPGVAAGWTI